MPVASPRTYLYDLVRVMHSHWPDNRTVNIVCHGHSVPAGYFATPMVETFRAYPHLLHKGLKAAYPFAVINVIVSAIGGENAASGAERFTQDVLAHQPDVVTIDYALNDRGLGLETARDAWVQMIEDSLARDAKLILLTPTADMTQHPESEPDKAAMLQEHAHQIRELADFYETGLVDSLGIFLDYAEDAELTDLLSWSNHPNELGHQLVADELLRWFPVA